ncbi:MAG: DinB family protein [Bryobacteraceae bacterium]|nr:DinB family protein [Bryobacteraceae bacterium]
MDTDRLVDRAVREQLVALLRGGQAHVTFDDVMEGFPASRAGERVAGAQHSAWELLEHLRIAQRDILVFSGGTAESYVELEWPREYWPTVAGPQEEGEWDRSVEAFREDLKRMVALVEDESRDLYEPFAWGQGQNLLREALLVADHNAYHLGQLMLMRRMLE